MPSTHKLPDKPANYKNGNGKTSRERNPDRIINTITFFGDSAILEEDPIYKSIFEASKLLAQNDYTIVNGGGPGLMKAATDGAEAVNGDTVAVYWEPKLASFFEGKNLANIADQSDAQSNYVVRTLGLIEKGDAYIVCKGGTGTISEFGLVWCLAKLYFGVHKPVILFGDFWKPMIEAIKTAMYIDEKELGVLYFAESAQEILDILLTHEAKLDLTMLRDTNGDESGFLLRPSLKKLAELYNRHAGEYHSDLASKLVAKEQLEEFVSLVNPPAQVLDVGCGPGYDTGFLSEHYSTTGIDISQRFVEIAQFENPNADIRYGDIVQVELPQNFYKGIWSRDAMHHVHDEDLPNVFRKISNALVDDGIFYLIVREGKGEIQEKEQKSYANLERFYNLFDEKKLKNLAKKSDLEVVKFEHTKKSHKWIIGVFKRKTRKEK